MLGEGAAARLSRARVAVFGLGGVGGAAAEALVRTGIGAVTVVDPDRIVPSNRNRQLLALESTAGEYKTAAAAGRFADISPETEITAYNVLFRDDTAGLFDFSAYDYVLDAVDDTAGKTALAARAAEAGTPIISCMGTGGRLDPSALRVADIYETRGCPLARVMRRELRRAGIKRLKTVYSIEPPVAGAENGVIPSCMFVPAAAGMLMAAEVVKDLCGADRTEEPYFGG